MLYDLLIKIKMIQELQKITKINKKIYTIYSGKWINCVSTSQK